MTLSSKRLLRITIPLPWLAVICLGVMTYLDHRYAVAFIAMNILAVATTMIVINSWLTERNKEEKGAPFRHLLLGAVLFWLIVGMMGFAAYINAEMSKFFVASILIAVISTVLVLSVWAKKNKHEI